MVLLDVILPPPDAVGMYSYLFMVVFLYPVVFWRSGAGRYLSLLRIALLVIWSVVSDDIALTLIRRSEGHLIFVIYVVICIAVIIFIVFIVFIKKTV
ncbi:hypothetical protein XM53_00920 [Roseovarius atlanticus]|uniref:Uncharacterized protein n=1 Tax=Roseovarius atlanticus TaxID=1641875 RepID=A0A0T5NZN5_9RHOB|nr:hypothetical protein XM53_00920 [Roseovarius atlanticus]